MIAVVPGYISRSVAGSYDNEGIPTVDVHKMLLLIKMSWKCRWWSVSLGIAIFCMLLTYYMWIKAVKTGSVYWSSVCALAYFYMVSGWNDASQEWFFLLLFDMIMCLHAGFLLGWLCVLDQPYTPPRSGFDAHRAIFSSNICGILHSLLSGHHPFHADILCWVPGKNISLVYKHS